MLFVEKELNFRCFEINFFFKPVTKKETWTMSIKILNKKETEEMLIFNTDIKFLANNWRSNYIRITFK